MTVGFKPFTLTEPVEPMVISADEDHTAEWDQYFAQKEWYDIEYDLYMNSQGFFIASLDRRVYDNSAGGNIYTNTGHVIRRVRYEGTYSSDVAFWAGGVAGGGMADFVRGIDADELS